MLGNLIPTLHVPQHLGLSCAEVIQLSYIIGTISWSSQRNSCHTTHTVQNASLFCSSSSCKLATLGNVIWLSCLLFFLVSLEYIWSCFCFFFFSIHFACLKTFVNYCNRTENLFPRSASQYKSDCQSSPKVSN